MSIEDTKAIVRRYYEDVFTRRNPAALDDLFAPDFVGHSAAYGDFTLADMRRAIARDYTGMPGDETIVAEQMADGERVMTRWTYRWRHDRSVWGEPPTGRWLAMEGIHIDRLVEGMIVERWEIKDVWGVVRQLGGTMAFPGS